MIPYELFSANYMPFTGPGFYQKPFLHEYELVLLTSCPLLTLFPAKVALLPDVSSFMLMTCHVLSPFPIKKHCYPIGALFCQMDTFTGQIRYQKNICHPNLTSFLLITYSLQVPFSIKKVLLPHMSFSC